MKETEEYKVLYLINHSVPYGANKALLNILDEIVPFGINPFVVMAFKGAMCDELEKRNIKYEIIEHYFSIYPTLDSAKDFFLFFPRLFRAWWLNFLAKKKIIKTVNTLKPDLIHTNIGPDHIGFQVALKMQIPHIWHIREYQDLDFKIYPMYSKKGFIKKLKNRNNYSIAITKGIFNHFSMSHNNAKVIYDGVLKTNQICFEKSKENYFLFAGRLEEAKGIKNLLEAFVEFCKYDETFGLLIAGTGRLNYTQDLKQFVIDANLTSRVEFLGFRDDVSILMSKATALIVPSRHEGFGFITVEAMFNGCLVIGNDTAGTREILHSENLGLLFSGKNELVQVMKSVTSVGVESYFPMIQKAQNRALFLYSQENNGNLILELYNELIKN